MPDDGDSSDSDSDWEHSWDMHNTHSDSKLHELNHNDSNHNNDDNQGIIQCPFGFELKHLNAPPASALEAKDLADNEAHSTVPSLILQTPWEEDHVAVFESHFFVTNFPDSRLKGLKLAV